MNMKNLRWFGLIFAFLILMMPEASIPAAPNLSANFSMVSPSSCPLGGCAAGQRLNFQTTFDLLTYTPSQIKNVQICLYAPENWAITEAGFESSGKLTGSLYTLDIANCGAPPANNYMLVTGVSTALTQNFFGDSIEFYLRLGNSATTSGSTLIRVFENNAGVWTQTEQSFGFLPVSPINAMMYVTNNADVCGTNSPCYVNSKDDLVNGIGTGLKDAIDAAPPDAIINVLGNYEIKSNQVQISKPLTIQGSQNASITTTHSVCSNPMLSLEHKVIIQNLNINDGTCSSLNRDLIIIASNENIGIFSNNLNGGRDAIRINNNQKGIQVRFNNIRKNSGYAINKISNSGTGLLSITANNIFENRPGEQVVCTNQGEANHNYWGIGVLPSTVAPSCITLPEKRLGSPILDNIATPGVQAKLLNVTTTKSYYFEDQIAVRRPTDNPNLTDFEIFIVNHGNNAANAPFLSPGSLSTLVPCNNYFDVFLAKDYQTALNLEMFFKYDLNAACVANVESTTYCNQSNAALYPLWWYDPAQLITTGWNTTGQAPNGPSAGGAMGQVTICSLQTKELVVQIDSTGRPGINNDLTFTPFVVGLIGQPAATVLTSFTATPGNMQVEIRWRTASELNTSGFYVQRRVTGDLQFNRISPFIVHTGTDTSGSNYSFLDNTAINLTSYDYRLEIVGTNLLSVYSNIISATPIPPTITPTTTATSTITQTSTITLTPTITQTPTITITTTPTISLTPTITNTSTITMTPTRTRFRTSTNTRTPFIIPYRSPTPSRTPLIFNTSPAGYPVITDQSNQTDPGYPASTEGVFTPDASYPMPGESTPTNGDYPAPDDQEQVGTSESQNGTPPAQTRTSYMANRTPTPTSTLPSEKSTDWIYPLLGSLIGFSLVLLVGYFLWKKGYMALPIKPKNDINKTDDLGK